MSRPQTWALLALTLAACGTQLPPAPPPVLELTINAGVDQNPETDGHAAPVGIRLYQLAGTGSFEQTDAFALMTNAPAVLGQDLLGSETLMLNPGETRKIHLPLKPGAQFLAAAVLFRNIDAAAWRGTAPLAQSGPTVLTLATQSTRMTIGP